MKEFELEPEEYVVEELRKHWFLFAIELIPYAILAVIPFALPNLVSLIPNSSHLSGYINYAEPVQRTFLVVWLLLVWTVAWGSFTRYFLNAWILTNRRIVNIKQRSFWNREVSGLLLPRVQDVTSDVRGMIPSLLGIGTITVQSAGEELEFVMRGIPRPDHMRDTILKYVAVQQHHDSPEL